MKMRARVTLGRKAWPDKEQVSGNRSAQILFKLLSVNIL
jgi:hypothetical protein